jgi:hypothetical protein
MSRSLRLRAMRRALSICLLLVVALVVGASASAGTRTTVPGAQIVIGVQLHDQSVNVFQGARAPRGSEVIFLITNWGKKRHNFAVFGKKTALLKPHQTAKITVFALARGEFPYRSTVDKGSRFRGMFTVY